MRTLPVWVLAFLVNFIVALAAILPYLIRDNGYFALPFDWSAEEMAYNIFMNRSIKEGSILWNWGIDLGGNFLESFGFYNLGSIFFWISMLFPADSMPHVMGWILILKFAAAGMTSALYFERHLESRAAIIVATMLYAFSGYQCSSIVFYHFQDVVVVFPFLLVGLERMKEDGKKGGLAIAAALNALCNYVFFAGEILFLVIFYVVKYLAPDIKAKQKKLGEILLPIGQCMLEGVIGIAIAGILMVPSVNGILSNSRASDHITASHWLEISFQELLLFLKGLLTPAESMGNYSCITDIHWMTDASWLPMFGVLFVLAYVFTRRDWLSATLKVSLVFALVPVLNNSFMLFSVEGYRRWFYMPILFMALATARVIEKPREYHILRGTAVAGTVFAGYYLMTRWIPWDENTDTLVFHRMDYYLGILLALGGGIAALAVVTLKKLQPHKNKIFICVTGLFSAFALIYSINCYQETVDNSNQDFAAYDNSYSEGAAAYLTEVAAQLDEDVLPYRYYFDEAIGHTYYNMAMSASLPSINSFLSTVHSSVQDFYDAMNRPRTTWTDGDNSGTRELLGARYVISVVEREDYNYELIGTIGNSNGQTFYLYENEDALPICFTLDSYMTKTEFEGFGTGYRALVMLNALVVEDDKEDAVSDILTHIGTVDEWLELSEKTVTESCAERGEEVCSSFEAGNNYFRATIDADSDKYAFFSVPYDKHWKAQVNGREEEVLNINGLMAVRVDEGANDITFTYEYTPIYVGIAVSLVGIVALGLYLWLGRKEHSSMITENGEG